MLLVSLQNARAVIFFCPFFFASRNCLLSGKKILTIPTPIDNPAPTQNTFYNNQHTSTTKGKSSLTFQELVLPPTPKFADAASTYPREYPCCKIPDIRPRALTGQCSSAIAIAFPYTPPMNSPNRLLTAKN